MGNIHTMLRIIALTILLAGCQTVGVPNADTNIDLSQRASGLAVISITVSGFQTGTFWYQIANLGNVQAPPVSLASNADSFGLDWNPGQAAGRTFKGRLAVVELPPGNFEIRRWVMLNGNAGTYTSRQPMQYRFTVGRGEVVYVGNVHTDIQQSASTTTLPYSTKISDEQARDLPLLFQKYPGIKRAMIRVAVPQGTESRGTGGTIDGLRDLLPNP